MAITSTHLHLRGTQPEDGRRASAGFRLLRTKKGPFVSISVVEHGGRQVTIYVDDLAVMQEIERVVSDATGALFDARDFS